MTSTISPIIIIVLLIIAINLFFLAIDHHHLRKTITEVWGAVLRLDFKIQQSIWREEEKNDLGD